MRARLVAMAALGRMISGRWRRAGVGADPDWPDPDWTDPRLLGWSDLLATAVWPALDEQTRTRHGEALKGFAVAHALNTARNGEILDQIERLVLRLNAAGIEPILLKGAAHLATGLWPTPGSRLVADIDLLVAPDEVDLAVAVLEALAGTGPQRREHPELSARKRHVPPVVGAGGPASVEVHHAVFAGTAARLAPFAKVAARAQPVTLGTARARVLAPDDRVVNALLHGPASSGTWLAPALHMRDLLDITFLADREGARIDWPRIEHRLAAQGWGGALEITNRCLATFTGLAPPFGDQGRLARADAARWMWQLDHPRTRRLGLAANQVGYALRSLAAGGEPRRWALGYILRPATYGRAFRRYVLGRSE